MRALAAALTLPTLFALAGCASDPVRPDAAPRTQVVDIGELGTFNPRPWMPLLALSPVEGAQDATLHRLRGLEEPARLARAVLTRFDATDATELLTQVLIESLRTLDVKRLYAMARPDKAALRPGAWREFGFRGGRVDKSFVFELAPGVLEGVSTSSPASRFAPFGQFRGNVGFQPSPAHRGGDLFEFELAYEVEAGRFDGRSIQNAVAAIGKVVDLGHRLGRASGRVDGPVEQAVVTRAPRLSGDSVFLAAEALRAWPSLMTEIPRFLVPDRLLTRRYDTHTGWEALPESARRLGPIRVPSGGLWTELDMVLRVDRAALKKVYPELASYLGDLKDLFAINPRLLDRYGDEVIAFSFDTQDFTLRLRGALAEGKLVPRSADGTPQWQHMVDPLAPSGRFVWDNRISIRVSGVTLEIRRFQWKLDFVIDESYTRIVAVMDEPPIVEAKGRLFGVVPVTVVDILIPSNVEELAGSFLYRLAESRDGAGALFDLAIVPGARQNRVVGRIDADLEDSGFIGFLLRLFGSRVLPEPGVRAEWRALMARLTDAMGEDFVLVKRHFGLDEERVAAATGR